MSPVVFFSCLLIIACSDAATTKKQDVTAVTDWLQRINKRYSATKVEVRQDSSCSTNTVPSYCSLSELYNSSVRFLTDAQLDKLNSAYSRFCIPECLDPIEIYYRCTLSRDDADYSVKFFRKGLCGQESGDYCEVRYFREYSGNYNGLSQLRSACDITNSGISSCSNTPDDEDCRTYVETFSSRMGCCTEPYLGRDVQSCSDDRVDEACTGVSSATGLVAPVFLMLFALVGFFF